MGIKAAGFRILVKPVEIKKKTESGIIIEYGENEKLEKGARVMGRVVDIGPAAWKKEDLGGFNWCKIGDMVLYARYAGKFVKDPVTQEEYVALNDEDVICIVEGYEDNDTDHLATLAA